MGGRGGGAAARWRPTKVLAHGGNNLTSLFMNLPEAFEYNTTAVAHTAVQHYNSTTVLAPVTWLP